MTEKEGHPAPACTSPSGERSWLKKASAVCKPQMQASTPCIRRAVLASVGRSVDEASREALAVGCGGGRHPCWTRSRFDSLGSRYCLTYSYQNTTSQRCNGFHAILARRLSWTNLVVGA